MNAPLTKVTPSYLYAQYGDDEALQAFIDSYNALAQSYLDWFNSTPLAIYTLATVSGSLLDWVGDNLYQVRRPAISNFQSFYFGALTTIPLATWPLVSSQYSSTGGSTLVSDDIYKRVITWFNYKGDGMQATLTWLRRRVARFLYGTNGTDCDPSDYLKVSIKYESSQSPAYLGATNTTATNTYSTTEAPIVDYWNQWQEAGSATSGPATVIELPNTGIGQTLYALFTQGDLIVPFQANLQVSIA